MPQTNARLAILVAAVAVAAVAAGGAFAYQQRPQTARTEVAAPLPGGGTSPSAGQTPTPAEPGQATPSGPVRSKLDLAKLPKGRVPQLPYAIDREVRGGAGGDEKIPARGDLIEVARVGQKVLAAAQVGDSGGVELLTMSYSQLESRTPDVSQIVTATDNTAGAYLVARRSQSGEELPGGTIHALTSDMSPVKKLAVPGGWGIALLAYADGRVYFRSDASQAGTTGRLWAWTPGEPTAELVKTVPNPTAVSADGRLAASQTEIVDGGSCSALVDVATGKRLWRTCEYGIRDFTPDGRTVIAGDAYEDGYANSVAAVLDSRTGNLIRAWEGTVLDRAAEDDQHLLVQADDGDETPSAIVRCSIPTGACELATALDRKRKVLGR